MYNVYYYCHRKEFQAVNCNKSNKKTIFQIRLLKVSPKRYSVPETILPLF